MPDPIRQALLQLRREQPHAHPYALSLLLEAAGLGRYSGRQVREWLDLLDAHPDAA